MRKVAYGAMFGLGLYNDGTIFTWGSNLVGESAIPKDLYGSTFIDIATGPNYAIVVDSFGAVYGWGNSTFGVLNIPDAAHTNVLAVDTGASHVLALKDDGSVVAWAQQLFAGQCAR